MRYESSVGGTYCHLSKSDERWWEVNHHDRFKNKFLLGSMQLILKVIYAICFPANLENYRNIILNLFAMLKIRNGTQSVTTPENIKRGF